MPGACNQTHKYYFYDLITLTGRHTRVRTTTELYLGIIRRRCYAVFLQKYVSVQICYLGHRDNDFPSLAEVLLLILRIQGRM